MQAQNGIFAEKNFFASAFYCLPSSFGQNKKNQQLKFVICIDIYCEIIHIYPVAEKDHFCYFFIRKLLRMLLGMYECSLSEQKPLPLAF